ncbi:MAG TPA: TonB-dependent receptor, partial [Gammaproteobacteria bacterium]|nr:TonB-dependent receptor [Gammaproteobacteria bacterium]
TTTTNNQSTAQLGKIEVTGTRIKRTDVETAQPITIITQKEIKATGLNNVGDILATMPQVRAMLNAQVNNGNDGQNTIDLRNLGPNRVLVLVNGKRWIGNIGGKVDFSTVPAAVIDHIEILQDGASAIYGSDAISGVVNVITVKNYNGAEANAYNGWYHGDSHTDGKAQAYDFTMGTSGDKSAALISVAYTQQDAASAADRKISVEPFAGTGVGFGGSSRTPAGRFRLVPIATNGTVPAGTCPGGSTLTTSGICDMTLKSFPANPSLNNFRDFHFAQDAYNFAPLNYLIAPNETTNLYTQAHYDLADNLTFTADGLFNNRSSSTKLAQPVLDIGSTTSGVFNIDKTNPYNPFGVTLTSNSNDPCIAAKSCDLLLDLGRRFAEAGPRVTTNDQTSFHFGGGFKGYFNMMGGEWDWDAGYEFNRMEDAKRETNVVDLGNLAKATGPAFNAGTAAHPDWECGTAAHPISNPNSIPGFKCVPTNLFGGAGSITPAMVNSDTFNPISDELNNQRDYTANMTGDLFDLPAGPLGLAFGGEYLEWDGVFDTDGPTTDGDNAENQNFSTAGRERTTAEYVEFNIPILADQPFAKDMNLDIAERWSQFKWGGGNPLDAASAVQHSANATTGRAALKWQTTDSLLLRASWSQGFRLPTISEFFGGQATAAIIVTDPCTSQEFANAHTNCGGLHTQADSQINTFQFANPELNPEKSESRTVGFVYNPDWLPGFDFSADYFKVEVNQFITFLNDATIFSECYAQNIQSECANILVRNHEIVHVTSIESNIGGDLTEGVDVSTHYKFPSTSMGDFKLGFDMTFLKEFNTTLPNPAGPGGFATSSLAGWATQSGSTAVSYPKRKGDLTLNWNFGPWSAQYMLRYTSDMWEPCNVTGSTALCTEQNTVVTSLPNVGAAIQGRNHLGSTTYHDISGTYHADSINTDFTIGIRNLFGKVPPISQQAFANSYLPTYDTPGQFFYARIGVKF